MAITSGFFNAVMENGVPDRVYSAEDFSKLFDGIIIDGVYEHIGDAFAVTAVNDSMDILIGTGRCWFNGVWLYNDSIFRKQLDPAFDLLNRIDSVVIEVDASTGVRDATIKILKGAGATVPMAPALANTAYVHQYRIANIFIKADADSISDENIEYLVGTDDTPYVTGPLSVVSSDAHWNKWYSELNNFMASQRQAFDTWFDTIRDILDESTAGNLQNEINDTRAWIPVMARNNGVLSDACLVDINTKDGVWNKPRVVDSATTISMPEDCAWGVRTVEWFAKNAVFVKIVGVKTDGKSTGVWVNGYWNNARDGYANWIGWKSVGSDTGFNFKGVITQAEYDALSEEDKRTGVYGIKG